jgi:polyribonucleotide nucleotidyltransferase
MNKEQVFTTQWLGRTLTIKTGKLARQANSAVTVQYGDTVVLATVVEDKKEREGIDFFPLMVDFEERLYAAGLIKGSRWVKREGRPSDEAILTGRMIDRSIRPLFPDEARRDVQVIITVLSADQINDHDIVALIAASASLAISGLDWAGPIGGVRVGRVDKQFVFNPTYEERKKSDLDLIVAGTDKKVVMIEAGANELKEEEIFKAICAGQKELQEPIDLIKKAQKEVKPLHLPAKKEKKLSPEEIEAEKEKGETVSLANEWLGKNINGTLFDKTYYTKGERKAAVEVIKENLDKYLIEKEVGKDKREYVLKQLVDPLVEAEVTKEILQNKRRVDGRQLDEIRPLSAEVEIFPRNHGSGLFARGETQIMSIVTLGPPSMAQALEGIEGIGTKGFMHHYNFPPFCTAEAKPIRSAGRRDIGHGALAEKALLPIIPAKEKFPYTIRVVSETLSSNGSSSMGSTCASSLSLMDAGVPIKKAVAGIAMGLASDKDMSQWEILTDIQDLEDGQGGMDFKITGTIDGITAIQLDTKTNGLTDEIIEKTLKQGLDARLQILKVMNKAIDKPRADLSPYAPRITSFHIDPDKIRDVIGAGGKTINKIIEETGASIDIEDDGLVIVCSSDKDGSAQAVEQIKNITREFQVGEIMAGKVVRLMDFGAFMELAPGRDGMVHVSELAPYRVNKPSDFLDIGDKVQVKIKEIDEQGRVNLTMLGLAENEPLWKDGKGKTSAYQRDNYRSAGKPGRFQPRGGGQSRFDQRSNRNNFRHQR